jgi:hypothetical protein
LTVGSSPLVANGTITLNLTTGLTQNQVLATPNGSSGTVGLRALVSADLPAAVVYNNVANTAGAAMTLNLSAATATNAFVLPTCPGGTIAGGTLCYNGTNYNGYIGGEQALTFAVNIGNGNIPMFLNSPFAEIASSSLTDNGTIVSLTEVFNFGSTVVGSLLSASAHPFATIGVTDSTTISAEGQTCVGGSTNKAIAISNGTVWKCF